MAQTREPDDLRLRNRGAQARWRERHIAKRRTVQRVANILLRQRLTDEHFAELGVLLRALFNMEAIRALRRELRDLTDKDMKALRRKQMVIYGCTRIPAGLPLNSGVCCATTAARFGNGFATRVKLRLPPNSGLGSATIRGKNSPSTCAR